MVILGIETTCDETGVGIVRNGREVLSNVVASSAAMHKKYWGIVPEVAAREQVMAIIPCVEQALKDAKCEFSDIDALAVSYGPGLVGSLLIGVETAKTLAAVFDKQLFAVNHLVGHVYANWVNLKLPEFPLVALIVSGGHTDLILMTDHQNFKWLGGTRDDAAGEAFDKVARILGLGYPGGPEIERVAKQLTTDYGQLTIKLPRPMISDDNFDFSFSGIKTSIVNLVKEISIASLREELSDEIKSEIAFEFQNAVVEVLVTKTIRAAKKYQVKSIVVGGGVAANNFLRSQFTVNNSQLNIPVFSPTKDLSVDNGTMIACAAYYQKNYVEPQKLQAVPGLHFA